MIPADAVKTLDSEIKYDQSREQHRRAHATIAAPTIFAVRYHLLRLNLEPMEKAKEQKSSSGFFSSWVSKLRFNKNSRLSGVARATIKSLSLGQPLRGGKQAMGSYGHIPDGLLYWAEPEYISPEDFVVEENVADAGGVPHGVPH